MAHGNDNSVITTPKFGGKFKTTDTNTKNVEDILERQVEPQVADPAPIPAQTTSAKAPKKAKGTAKTSRQAKDNRHERMTFYVSKEEEKDIKIATAILDTSVTYIGRKATLGYIYNGYVCAACGKSFILLNDEDNKKDKPNTCPCCGNDKLGRIVNL